MSDPSKMINEIQARTILKQVIPVFGNEVLGELIQDLLMTEQPSNSKYHIQRKIYYPELLKVIKKSILSDIKKKK